MGQGSIVGYRVREKMADLPAQSDAFGMTPWSQGSFVSEEDDATVESLIVLTQA